MTGSGSQNDPYIISTVTDLQNVENDLDAYYELGGNIDASATSGWNAGAGFLPIGQTGNGFTGQLDGKDYTISSLFINRPATDGVGLFRYAMGATIQHVNLTSVDITGQDYAGALIGYLEDAVVDNCSSTGSIACKIGAGLIGYAYKYSGSGSTISDSYSSCTITAILQGAGFIAVDEYSTITNCYATGATTVTDATGAIGSAGGFAYWLEYSTVSKCYATGAATTPIALYNQKEAGGFVAYMKGGSITNCYARGAATATGAAGFIETTGGATVVATIDNCYSTGLVTQYGGATNSGFCWSNYLIVITNCFWDTETSGQTTSDGGTGKTTAQMKTLATFVDAGWDFTTIWSISASYNGGYPHLQGVLPPLMPIGTIWNELTKLHWIDANGAEQSKEGTIAHLCEDPQPYPTLWWEKTLVDSNLMYTDRNSLPPPKRSLLGVATGVTGQPKGTSWIEGTAIHGIDEAGAEVYIEGA